jgi:hypothetical protein
VGQKNGWEPFGLEARLSRSKSRHARYQVAQARVTQDEYEEVLSAAKREGRALGEWVREVLLREARRSPRDPVFAEIVATRMLLNLVLQHVACGELMTAEMFTDMLTKVRTTKHKQALELMEQYATTDPKED